MLDAGVHPAYEGISSLPFYDDFDLSTVDILLISQYDILFQYLLRERVLTAHSFHLDHAGSLPYVLTKTNFRGRVYMTHPTKAIYKWLMSDSVRVRYVLIPPLGPMDSWNGLMSKYSPFNERAARYGELFAMFVIIRPPIPLYRSCFVIASFSCFSSPLCNGWHFQTNPRSQAQSMSHMIFSPHPQRCSLIESHEKYNSILTSIPTGGRFLYIDVPIELMIMHSNAVRTYAHEILTIMVSFLLVVTRHRSKPPSSFLSKTISRHSRRSPRSITIRPFTMRQ